MKDPLWKTVLNWGTVITFLTLPMTILCIQIYANTHPGWWRWGDPAATWEQHHRRFEYLFDFMRNITILVFGLAGLRTWENIKNGKTRDSENAPRNVIDH